MSAAWAALRTIRYALPDKAGRVVPAPGPRAALRACRALERRDMAATVGYFQAGDAAPDDIVAANVEMAGLLAQSPGACLSVKAPPLAFDLDRLRTIADAAAPAGASLMFDSHALKDAERTLDCVASLFPDVEGIGFALPARWSRSLADAEAFRARPARIRLVKGEWADPDPPDGDVEANYLALAARLAGRAAPVGVATHDPGLAERALGLLRRAGTPCELEQLRGLPGRRTMAIARRLGVPVRVYVPFGPGWWPYALDKALARPYLLKWIIHDRLARQAPPPAMAG